MRYIEGCDREQFQFFNRLDELIKENNYVRLIDAFVDSFISKFISTFNKGEKETGRKAYHPGSLLKLYIYSYLNGISSSRKIERECYRNIEVMWLMCQLTPDHKTISDFRRDNQEGIKLAFKELNLLLKASGYLNGSTISIDGSKLRANASKCIDIESITKRLDNLESQLEGYLVRINTIDDSDEELDNKKQEKEKLEKEISALKERVNDLKKQKESLAGSGRKRINVTDPDSRIMKSRQGKHFCFNMQAAIDSKNHLITTTSVVSNENDRGQLVPMMKQLKNELNISPKEILADAGYYVISEIEYLEKEEGIDCYVAINYNQEKGKRISFRYDDESDRYFCSMGQELKPKFGWKRDNRRGTMAKAYKGINCEPCTSRLECTKSKSRTVYRFSNQEWRDSYEDKLNSNEGKSRLIQRKALSEHPFGTIKYWAGSIPLKVRGLKKVTGEVNLYALCYNLRRMMNIESFETLMRLFKNKSYSQNSIFS